MTKLMLWLLTVAGLVLSAAPARADYSIPVLFIRTADDDGSKPSTLTEATAKAAIQLANTVYKRNGGDVQFTLDPASSFTTVIKSTTLNHDCKLAPGQTAATIAAQTTQLADTDTLCDTGPAATARAAMALTCAGKLVVFSRGGSEYISWNADLHHYELKYATGGYSGSQLFYVVLGSSFSGNDLGHEIGHYMHLAHPFGGLAPKTVAAAEQAIKDYVAAGHAEADGLKVFEGDGVSDTPPDAAGGVFVDKYGANANCDPAHPTVPLTVHFTGHDRTYTLAPDRNDVMSYFKNCSGFDQHLTAGQWAIVHAALTTGNRATLVTLPMAPGDGCHSRDPAHACPLQPPPPDPSVQLASVAKHVANCYKLWRRPLPGEINEITNPGRPVVRLKVPVTIVHE